VILFRSALKEKRISLFSVPLIDVQKALPVFAVVLAV
jgi:hypothetical protein